MAVPDRSIDPMLLKSAKEEFLRNGYENASTNVICKNAGVTTGALFKRYSSKNDLFWAVVNPTLEKVKKAFVENLESIFNEIRKGNNNNTNEKYYFFDFLNFVYEDYDIFKIIIDKSSQLQFADFLHYFVDIQTKYMVNFIHEINPKALNEKIISEQTIHILVASYFNGQFEVVRHNENKNDAYLYVKQMQNFYLKSWLSIMGLDK